MDARGGFWEVVEQVVSPLTFLKRSLVGGGLVILFSTRTSCSSFIYIVAFNAGGLKSVYLTEAFMIPLCSGHEVPKWFQCVDFPSTDFGILC